MRHPLSTALPGRGATIVNATTLSPIPAKAGARVPRATRGAWWRRRQGLTNLVFSRLLVRLCVLSVPKLLSYFMQRDGAVLNSAADIPKGQ